MKKRRRVDFKLFLAGIFFLAAMLNAKDFAHGDLPADNAPLRPKMLYEVPPGPWGDLDYYMIWLEVPEWYLDQLPLPSDKTVWRFPDLVVSQVRYLFQDAGFKLTEDEWNQRFKWVNVPGEETLLSPSDDFIVGLTTEQRSALSQILQRHSAHFYYQNPVVVESGDVQEWFSSSGLSAETVALIELLCYPRGESLLFSDVEYVCNRIETLEERKRFFASLFRTRTLVLRINVGEQMDFEQVADYWSNGSKFKAVLPMLKAVSETPGTDGLDVAHLLPPVPRRLLYSFPEISDGLLGDLPDCHWTSFNFFKTHPLPEMQNRILQNQIRMESVEPATSDLRFGDIIVLSDPQDGKIIHSAVYIAGDIVFTKNGMALQRPWILMRYNDMLSRYSMDFTPNTQVYRQKS